jgi:hypothetical protein
MFFTLFLSCDREARHEVSAKAYRSAYPLGYPEGNRQILIQR